MEMSDSLHVPVEELGQGTRRYVWDLPYGRVLIDVFVDGRMMVNGSAVGDAAVDLPTVGRQANAQPAAGKPAGAPPVQPVAVPATSPIEAANHWDPQ